MTIAGSLCVKITSISPTGADVKLGSAALKANLTNMLWLMCVHYRVNAQTRVDGRSRH